MSLHQPLTERTQGTTPIGDILHELDLARQFMREYAVNAIAHQLQGGAVRMGFDKWKEVKAYKYDYTSANAGKVGTFKYIP